MTAAVFVLPLAMVTALVPITAPALNMDLVAHAPKNRLDVANIIRKLFSADSNFTALRVHHEPKQNLEGRHVRTLYHAVHADLVEWSSTDPHTWVSRPRPPQVIELIELE